MRETCNLLTVLPQACDGVSVPLCYFIEDLWCDRFAVPPLSLHLSAPSIERDRRPYVGPSANLRIRQNSTSIHHQRFWN